MIKQTGCPTCGYENPKGVARCHNCGDVINGSIKSEPQKRIRQLSRNVLKMSDSDK